MIRVRLSGWNPGLNKVALTKLIREAADIPLNEAHDAVNRLLEGESVEFGILDAQVAQRLLDDARALGAKAETVKTPVSTAS